MFGLAHSLALHVLYAQSILLPRTRSRTMMAEFCPESKSNVKSFTSGGSEIGCFRFVINVSIVIVSIVLFVRRFPISG